MAAHRYWRALGLEAYGLAGLELTEFQLIAGTTRVDASATLTSSAAPTTGSLANLKDDSTATGAIWSVSGLRSLVLSWDFGGSPQDVTDIRLGAGASVVTFLRACTVQFSDDALTWTTVDLTLRILAFKWPGSRTKTSSLARGVWNRYDNGVASMIAPNPADERQAVRVAGNVAGFLAGLVYASSGVRQLEIVTTGAMSIIVALVTAAHARTINPGQTAGEGVGFFPSSGQKYVGGTSSAYGSSLASGDTLGVVFDYTAGTVTFYKNGVSMGVAISTLAGKPLTPAIAYSSSAASVSTLKTSGFTYPIAGATAWDDVIVIETQPAAVAVPSRIAVPTGISVALPYGQISTRQPIRARRDYLTGVLGKGIGRVRGTVVDKAVPTNTPVYRRVRLVREQDGLVIREAWSDPVTGAYDFQYVDELQEYAVWGRDHLNNKQGVINDHLTLANGKVELMA